MPEVLPSNAAPPPALSRPVRRTPVLVLVGSLVLGLTTVAGYGWLFADWLDDAGSVDAVRFGNAGLLVAVAGWAAFARTRARAAVRAVVGAIVLPVVAVGGVFAAQAVADALKARADEFQPVNEFRLQPWVVVDLLDLLGLVVIAVGVLGVLIALGVGARAQASAAEPDRRWLVGGLLAVVLADGVWSLVAGAEAAALLAVVSAVWLRWVLGRARAAWQPSPPR